MNATPLGMRPGDPLPFDPAELPPNALVADIIMKSRETERLCKAAELGHPVLHVEPVLRHRMDLSLSYFGAAR